MKILTTCILCWMLFPLTLSAGNEVDYVTQIKPILAARCYACHSALRQKSGLRLDTAALLIQGGDSGAAIVPGDSAASAVIERITAEIDLRMPPESEGSPLSGDEIALIRQWIDEGARAPEETPGPDPRQHWAYQPPQRPAVPQSADQLWVRNPVDGFVASGHQSQGLVPNEPADKGSLLRRVYLDLVGLPPTREELAAFRVDQSPQAYEKVVDRLLESPQYGERWARHWMDVWRYSDWSGHGEQIRTSARHVWRWRDWIIESLNADKGYDQMVVEMLAGDEVAPTDPGTLRATGFLVRNWDRYNRTTWLENTIGHTAKAFLGVTMSCARCHDHKYDPIDQEEYYELRAVFEPHDVRTDRVPGESNLEKDGLARVCDLKPETPTYLFERGLEIRPDTTNPLKPGVPEVLGGEFNPQPIDLPIAARYPVLQDFVIQEDSARAVQTIAEREAARTKAQTEVPAAQKKVEEAGEDEAKVAEARKAVESAVAAAELAARQLTTAQAAEVSLAARVAAERAKYGLVLGGNTEQLALTAGKAERELALCQAQESQLAAELEMARAKASEKADDPKTKEAVEEAQKKLAEATAAVTAAHAALASPSAEYTAFGEVAPAQSTGRRLALARWITARGNPLAARVAVNHIWLRHFGSPLVDNMFDFGLRSPQARNQQLLDWLAVELMDHGWQMKHVHRLLVTSNAYRMRSAPSEAALANVERDRDNRNLWRMNTRRLEAEAVRDSLFYLAGNLDLARGGPDIDCFSAANTPRRSVYFRHAYEKQMKFLELFDGASVNECYRRSESVVPLQALALANGEVAQDQSRVLAGRLAELAGKDAAPEQTFVKLAFEHILNREPSAPESEACLEFLAKESELLRSPDELSAIGGGTKPTVTPSADPMQRARENLTHVLVNHNDFVTIR